MNMYVKKSILLFCPLLLYFLLFFLLPTQQNKANAQIIPQLEETILISTSPQLPKPDDNVTVSVESFSVDLDRSEISWFLNDVLKSQGDGIKDFSLTLGSLGSSSKIDVVIETNGGVIATQQIILRPVGIDLIWQANTYYPSFYKGKALPSTGSSVTMYTFPHFINKNGNRISPNNLIYTWRIDGNIVQNSSKRGNNSIVLTNLKPKRSVVVEVEIYSIDNSLRGSKSIIIPLTDPEIIVYEDNPLLGILFNRSVGDTYSLTQNEVRFTAYPYFMSAGRRNEQHIVYSWQIDRKKIELGDDAGSITVSQSGEEGTANISVSVKNTSDIFQRSDKSFLIEFGRNISRNFGL